jgi:hypothetical protein
MNCLYSGPALGKNQPDGDLYDIAMQLSRPENANLRRQVAGYAAENGLHELEDSSGTSILVQLIDTARLNPKKLPPEIACNPDYVKEQQPVILVMDYAFGEQAFETMDELLKPYNEGASKFRMNVASISIMGKAGILTGDKGDIMIPTSHISRAPPTTTRSTTALRRKTSRGPACRCTKGP